MKTHLLALTLGSSLALLSPALAQNAKLDAPLEVEVPAGEGLVEVDELIRAWARQTGRRPHASRSVANLKIRLGVGGHTLERAELCALLADHDVLLVESEQRVRALHYREAQTRIDNSQGRLYTQDEALPKHNTPATLVYRVQHGAGSTIFANLRGLMSRDPLRIGNLLYVQGPEQIIIFDLAPKVAYYRSILERLDLPVQALSQQVTIYEVPDASWTRLKAQPSEAAAAALIKLASEGKVTRHDEARVVGERFAFSKELRDAKGSELQLDLRIHQPSGKNQPLGPLSLSVSLHRQAQDGARQSRRLQVGLPPANATTLVSAKLDQGELETHLVVVVSPTR